MEKITELRRLRTIATASNDMLTSRLNDVIVNQNIIIDHYKEAEQIRREKKEIRREKIILLRRLINVFLLTYFLADIFRSLF